jgi:hypothetical protein
MQISHLPTHAGERMLRMTSIVNENPAKKNWWISHKIRTPGSVKV